MTLPDIQKDTSLDAINDKKFFDTLSVSGDSGCCNLSTSTEPADLTELYQDFRVSKFLLSIAKF